MHKHNLAINTPKTQAWAQRFCRNESTDRRFVPNFPKIRAMGEYFCRNVRIAHRDKLSKYGNEKMSGVVAPVFSSFFGSLSFFFFRKKKKEMNEKIF